MSRRREDRLEAGAGRPAPRNLWLRRDLLEKMEKVSAPATTTRAASSARSAPAPEDTPRPHAAPRRAWR